MIHIVLYRNITWWPDAYHVFDNEKRLGIVNRHTVRINGTLERVIWEAHNANFCQIKGEFPSRTAAAEALPKGAVHQSIAAFS